MPNYNYCCAYAQSDLSLQWARICQLVPFATEVLRNYKKHCTNPTYLNYSIARCYIATARKATMQ